RCFFTDEWCAWQKRNDKNDWAFRVFRGGDAASFAQRRDGCRDQRDKQQPGQVRPPLFFLVAAPAGARNPSGTLPAPLILLSLEHLSWPTKFFRSARTTIEASVLSRARSAKLNRNIAAPLQFASRSQSLVCLFALGWHLPAQARTCSQVHNGCVAKCMRLGIGAARKRGIPQPMPADVCQAHCIGWTNE